ncbi:unnamed protein product [Closterium sp. Naga37s-1]|nr:unnamed protein product [Closterium sp. Naga37s-1]
MRSVTPKTRFRTPAVAWPRSADVAILFLLLAAFALSATASACSLSSAPRPNRRGAAQSAGRRNQDTVSRRDAVSRLSKQRLLSRARPSRARRSLLKVTATSAAKPVILENSQLKALVQLQEAWGMWAGNSNATTACSAWTGVTCSPNGLVTALCVSLPSIPKLP